jgi:NAD(P)-dependent dehydrogenase (short-subunit alcohol dehydrogenase family)
VPPGELTGRAAVVTGAARGIGRAVARRLAAAGAAVLAVDLDERAAADAVSAIGEAGGRAAFLAADVTREVDVAAMIGHAQSELGGLDVLVANAGGYASPVFPEAPVEHWSATLDLNLRAPMLAIQHAVPAMAARGGGAIVNVASSAGLGLAPHPGPEYAAAKAGVMRLTACLGPLAARGIRVNCVCPHTVATEAVQQTIDELAAQGRELPWDLRGPLITLDEIAAAVLRLATDDALAGRVLVMRGGRPARLLDAAGDPYVTGDGEHP